MKRVQKPAGAATAILAVLFLASCASDPTAGGMFWNECGSRKRIAALRQELNMEKESANQAQNEARAAKRKYAAQAGPAAPVKTRPQAPAATRTASQPADPGGPTEEQLAAERERLKKEIETLKEENRARQQGI